MWYPQVWGNHKLEEFSLLISNHPAQTNIHTGQSYFHDGGTSQNYWNLYSLGVLKMFCIYILSLNWMTTDDDIECSANISRSENCMKELIYVYIKVLLVINSAIL